MSDTPLRSSELASPVVRHIRTALALILALAVLANAMDVYRMLGYVFVTEQFLAATLAVGLALVFMNYPFVRGTDRNFVPWYDWALAAAGLLAGLYIAWNATSLSENLFDPPLIALVAAWIMFVLCIEGLRRTVGWSLVWVVLFFMIYAMIGHKLWGMLQTKQVFLNSFVYYLIIDQSGLLGIVMNVAITIVIPFILFGALLSVSGGAAFFNDIAIALMGRYRGGAAKMSVLASGLFGSISGVVVSNIMATGVVTIPLMKRAGFTPAQAGVIEATASNGGQLMPPVMGAVAFLMADFLQVPYAKVALAAFIPGLLYYTALFIQADLIAARDGIARVPENEIPRAWAVLKKGWHFILPFVVLIYGLFALNQEPEVAALWASLTIFILGLLFGYDGKRMNLRDLWDCVVGTGIGALDIFMVAAGAGFIMGMLQVTGLGFALTLLLVSVGEGSVLLLLLFAAILCIVLGMGMPTLGVYVLLAVLIAPSLEKVGIPQISAHFFILYMGLMSMVTPPVAVAAFFAASLAGADPMKTGFEAVRFSWAAYIVPFLFVFSPTLLLQSPSISATVLAVVTAIAGVWIVTAGVVGYLFGRIGALERVLLTAAGIALLIPHEIGLWAIWTDIVGTIAACFMVVRRYLVHRKSAVANPVSQPAESG
jgi:TRAP transporter 4TM/12TM fusion protein